MKRGRPTRDESRDTRQALVDAGLELFAEKGYFGTSLRDIAEAIGVRDSALYHYFPSKDALFEAIVTEGREPGTAATQWLDRTIDSPRDVLMQLGSAIVARFATDRERKLYRILMSDGLRLANDGRLNFLERTGTHTNFVVRLMTKLIDEGWFRPSRADFYAMEFFAPFGMWRQIQAVQPNNPIVKDVESFVRAHVDHFVRGAAMPGKEGLVDEQQLRE